MDIILSSYGIDALDCEVLATGFFQDERPLKGTSGLIDWRLNGLLSRLLRQNKITGEWKETTLLPSRGRIPSKLILLFGLGRIEQYSSSRLRELSPYLINKVKNLKASRICFSFPSGQPYDLDSGKVAALLIEGIVDCLEGEHDPADEEWVRGLALFFMEEETRFREILLGLRSVQSALGEWTKPRILVPSEKRI